MEINKKLNNDLKSLVYFGIGYLLAGLVCFAVLFEVTAKDPMLNLIFALVGIILGYLGVEYANPGGSVTFYYLFARERSSEEERLYELIIKYKSKLLVRLITIIFIFVITIKSVLNSYTPNTLDTNNIVWLIFWTCITSLSLGNGAKYLSAWWNIKKAKII